MKFVIIGATGTIGRKVAEKLENTSHEIIKVGSKTEGLSIRYYFFKVY